MKDKIDKTKKTVQFNPLVPEVNIPTLPVSFHSKQKNEEIVLKRLRDLVDNDSNNASVEDGRVNQYLSFLTLKKNSSIVLKISWELCTRSCTTDNHIHCF